jgi:hypothetical protein
LKQAGAEIKQNFAHPTPGRGKNNLFWHPMPPFAILLSIKLITDIAPVVHAKEFGYAT